MQSERLSEHLEPSGAQLQDTIEQQKALTAVISRLRQSLELATIFQTTATEIRQLLQADRVGVFRFDPDANWEGEFVSEDVAAGFDSAIATKVYDHCFGPNFSAAYAQGRVQAVADIYAAGLSECHIKILGKFQVRANLAVPLLKGDQLWGLLCIHQCSAPRHWQSTEIEFVQLIAEHLIVAIQQADYLQQVRTQAVQQKALADVIARIRASLDLKTTFQTTVMDVRGLLKADRVAVFQFDLKTDWEGEFISEDVADGFSSAIAAKVYDHCFGSQYADKYQQGRIQAVADIHEAGLSACHTEILEKFQVRANLVVPLLKGEQLWGLLCIHQCRQPRHWQPSEIEFVKQIADNLGVALQHNESLVQAQLQAERQKALTGVIARIRESLDLATIFQTTVTEVRQLLRADRVGVFRFDSTRDWEGEFISEDVAVEFNSAMAAKVYDHCFGQQYAVHYQEGRVQAIADIYEAGLSDCHVKILSQFQVRANLAVPLLNGDQLWGLLCIHQCAAPRSWQVSEIEFVKQISEQLGIALKQDAFLTTLQQQSKRLAEAAERERAMDRQKLLASTIDKIRRSLDLNSVFETTTQSVRELLGVERVAIYRFNEDWSGKFVADSIKDGAFSVLPSPTAINLLQPDEAGEYPRNETFVPISQGEKLWGLLVAYQTSSYRYWEAAEVNLLAQVGVQLGIAIQQSELLAQTQRQTAELTETLQTLRTTQAQLIQGEKMASLGQLVAGVAHEINNPVSFIFGNLTPVNEYANDLLKLVEFYRQQYPATELQSDLESIDVNFIQNDFPNVIKSMGVGAQRIREIVLSLQNFSRSDESGVKAVNLHEGIDSTLLILGHRFRKSGDRPEISLVKDYSNLPLIECYPAQINQVFMNILANSLDALEEKYEFMPESVLRIEIKTEIQGNQVMIQLQDNALGVPEAVRDRIFDPFFTTKAPGKGTGLGLSISYQIITERHGGTLECKSHSPEGTTFVITLPTTLNG